MSFTRHTHDFEIRAHLQAADDRVGLLLERLDVAVGALQEIANGICASAPDKHLDPQESYCGGACFVCVARRALWSPATPARCPCVPCDLAKDSTKG